jgi:uncharacterized membrane protein
MGVSENRHDPLWRWRRIVRARPRLFVAILLGLAIMPVTPADWRPATRALVGWDAAVGLYLVLAFHQMANCTANHIRRWAAVQDEGRFTILTLVVASALASLMAILAELSGANRQPAQLALAGVTVLLSWAFMHTIFAFHYAHAYYYYGERHLREGEMAAEKAAKGGGGLSFPGEETPDYWDFMYFSFVIGMTSQVSDVAVTSRFLRRLVAVHGTVSFVFNVTLLALMVNIAAGAI